MTGLDDGPRLAMAHSIWDDDRYDRDGERQKEPAQDALQLPQARASPSGDADPQNVEHVC